MGTYFVKKIVKRSPRPQQNMAARGDSMDAKIRQLDGELARYRDQIRKARPGPAQEAVKQRAMRVLKQKKM